jgi:hypothetical protein
VAVSFALSGCSQYVLYKAPEYNFAGRPTPPSLLLHRVLAAYSANGSSGGIEILDGERDLRRNVQNTIPFYSISGFSAAEPIQILNFPEETRGYVESYTDGNLGSINYSTEASTGSAASFGADPASVAAAPTGSVFAGASENAGQLIVSSGGGSYALNLPNVYKVYIDQGSSLVLAMVRNSNTLYRVVKLPATSNPVTPPGAVDCQPLLLPVLCVVPVGGTYDHPIAASSSLDGNTIYVLNCGPECGGTTASVTFLQAGALNLNLVPTTVAPSAMLTLPVANPVPIPGGVTTSLSDGTNLYLAGQQLQSNGLFAGNLTLLNLSTYIAGAPISIADGTHNKILFADDNTMWIGSTQCANGVRAALATKQLASTGVTTQAANYNCLTMVTLGATTPTAQIIPAVVQSTSTSTPSVPVAYPNTNENLYYYGSATGICWVQYLHKVYSAYGGQIHAFYTGGTISDQNDPSYGQTPAAGTEVNNTNVTVQGTVLDVAFPDATTNSAD